MTRDSVDFKTIPDEPGVYRFINGSVVLYVGKATSLRDRVKSYFNPDIAAIRSPLIEKIIRDATDVVWEKTDSVLEALILEAKYIKKYTPIGNTDLKDNKSWNYVMITNETFPRVLVARERELEARFGISAGKALRSRDAVRYLFGPFTSGTTLKEALKLIRTIFPFFDTPFLVDGPHTPAQTKTLAFNQSIGIYPPADNPRDYARSIRAIADIFSGKKHILITRLEKAMHRAAATQAFELAHILKGQIFALKHIRDITLIKEELRAPQSIPFRIEAYDTAHIRGAAARGVMVVVISGEPDRSQYRTFTIHAPAGDDLAALEEIVSRRAAHPEWPFPNLVVIDGGPTHVRRAKKALAEAGMHTEVVAVVKDNRHRPREILGPKTLTGAHESTILLANAEAHRFAINKHRKALRRRLSTGNDSI